MFSESFKKSVEQKKFTHEMFYCEFFTDIFFVDIFFIGNISTLLWLRDYEKFYEKGAPTDLFSLFGFDVGSDRRKSNNDPTKTGLDYDKLDDFLESPFYVHWKTFMRVTRTR